jgi:putative oxidoreductase
MKIVTVIVRVLLGLPFLFSGVFVIHPFKPIPPQPGDVGTLSTIMMQHHWFLFIGVLYLIAGLLLLIGKYVPVGLVILGPILVVILLFHITLAPSGLVAPMVLTLFEVFLIYRYWPAFRGVFTA